MIIQGLFRILELFSNDINLFYDKIYNYFRVALDSSFKENIIEKESFDQTINKFLLILKNNFIILGFEPIELEDSFLNPLQEIIERKHGNITQISDLFEKTIPMVYEFFLEKIYNYLVDNNSASIMLTLKSKNILPFEFIMELREIKKSFEKDPEKIDKLRKYLQIRQNIVNKLKENKRKIESMENLEDHSDRLQLFYMIYQIIAFFNIQKMFDFSKIKDYIKDNCDEWLDTIPLVSLKNPDLYYCGIFLAKELNIPVDEDNIKYFLLNIYDENIDEFEAPIIEATNNVFYFFKSSWLVDLWLSDGQIIELLKGKQKFFDINYLKNLETSRLSLVLQIYSLLGFYNKIDPLRINSIFTEIEQRITPAGIKQYRDGIICSEAIYYVLFCNYMKNNLKSLKDFNLLDKIVSRIYRNLEILDFSKEINYDLVSEIYYSCECLKLLNCLDTKQMIMLLAKYLLPNKIIKKIQNDKNKSSENSKLRDLHISKITGELIN